MVQRVRDWTARQAKEYADGEDRPLGGYLALMSIYSTGVAGAALASRTLTRPAPSRVGVLDLVQLTVATHRLSRTISKDPVTSPFRAPFTRYAGVASAGELHEEVRGEGLQHSAGELISCPMCLAQWVATALCAGLVLAPTTTRLILATFTAVGGADFLHHLYSTLQQVDEK